MGFNPFKFKTILSNLCKNIDQIGPIYPNLAYIYVNEKLLSLIYRHVNKMSYFRNPNLWDLKKSSSPNIGVMTATISY